MASPTKQAQLDAQARAANTRLKQVGRDMSKFGDKALSTASSAATSVSKGIRNADNALLDGIQKVSPGAAAALRKNRR